MANHKSSILTYQKQDMQLRKYKSILKNFFNACIRFAAGLTRPSKAINTHLLQERGETCACLIVRPATAADIHRLADLHVRAWNETYTNVKHPPTYYVREYQWRQQFVADDDNWFCFVVENKR